MSEQQKDNAKLTARVAAELGENMNSGSAFWDEFHVMECEPQDDGTIRFLLEHMDGGKTIVIVTPKWIAGWK